MGSVQSTVTKQTLSDFTSTVNKTIMKSVNVSEAKCGTQNSLTVNYCQCPSGSPFQFCSEVTGNFTSNQVADSSCKVIATSTFDTTSSFVNDTQKTVKNFIENNLQNKQGFFATGLSIDSVYNNNKNKLITDISNEMEITLSNTCKSYANANNVGIYTFCGRIDGSINLDQNATSISMTSCVNKAVIDAFSSNTDLTNFYNSTNNKLKTQQSGFSIFGNLWLYLLIFGVISLVIAGIIALVKIFKPPKPESSPENEGIPMNEMANMEPNNEGTSPPPQNTEN